MKLSIFTTLTYPDTRGDTWNEAISCYEQLTDEIVVVEGDKKFETEVAFFMPTKVSVIQNEWPKEFDWPFIGQQFQRGYEACTGDWVIHADLDFIFHERDYRAIRMACENNPDAPALSFWKFQFILPDRYNLKSRLVVAVNKNKYGDRIRFDSGGDLCQPSLDGQYISPSDIPEAGIPIYNYEKIIKTEAQIKDDVERMARAWTRHFGDTHLGTTETAYQEWLNMVVGRFSKPAKHIKLNDHPKVMQDTIKNLTPEMWGYSGHGKLGENNYVQSS